MKNKEFTFKDLAVLIIPKLWIIILVSAICAGAVFVYSSFFKNDTYTSSSQHYIYSKNSEEANTSGVDTAKGMVEVYKIMIGSDKFLAPIVAGLPQYEGLTAAHIRSMLSVTQNNDTPVFTISITSSDPKLSYDLAWKISEELPAGIQKLIPNALVSTPFSDPTLTTTPNPKHEFRNSFVAFFFVAILSIICIWVYSIFDVKIRDDKKIKDNLELPILGVIPRHNVDVESSVQGGEANV